LKSIVAIAIHGGAGVMRNITAAAAAGYRCGLAQALEAGHRILREGGTSLDAVSAAVIALEDDPRFNAGRGAVYNADEQHEFDASIMDGASLRAGGVTAVRGIRNPVLAARAVMEKSPHVLLAGRGAERFARGLGLRFAPRSYFHTDERLAALRRGLKRHHGTVGAVALDRRGNLAAATSTGGTTGKLAGRVGDSPIVGAGTYADNATCAVSGTGWGEAFIRAAVAHEVSARMRHRGEPLARAAAGALAAVARLGGDGGLVALDRDGHVAMPFNSDGMFRACVRSDGRRLIGIHR
jgi:L-asparaginase / beta-aspartyl-peptidase